MFATSYNSKKIRVSNESDLAAVNATTGSFSGAATLGSLTIPNGGTVNVGTSGVSSPLNVYGNITGFGNLSVSGSTSFQSIGGSSLLLSGTATAANITISNGGTAQIGTSGTSSILNVLGTATISTLSATTATCGTLSVPNGGSVTVGTSGTTSSLTVYGSITSNTGSIVGLLSAGSLSISGSTTLSGLTATSAGLSSLTVSGTVGITGLLTTGSITLVNGSALSVGISGTTSSMSVYGLISGFNGLVITGGASFQSVAASTISASGLVSANNGISIVGILTAEATVVGGSLNVNAALRMNCTVTNATNYTVSSTDNLIEFTTPTGTVVVTLPTLASSGGRMLIFTNSSTTNATLVITPASGEKIDGIISTLTVPTGSASSIIASTQSWYVL